MELFAWDGYREVNCCVSFISRSRLISSHKAWYSNLLSLIRRLRHKTSCDNKSHGIIRTSDIKHTKVNELSMLYLFRFSADSKSKYFFNCVYWSLNKHNTKSDMCNFQLRGFFCRRRLAAHDSGPLNRVIKHQQISCMIMKDKCLSCQFMD